MSFPEDFGWGVGIPSVTAEGAAPVSDLGAWVREGRHAPLDGNGFATAFADDFGLLAGSGARAVRLTLDWARIEPANGQVDDAAVDHLRLVLGAAQEAGLAVWACLHDGPLPGWFAHDERGFGDARSRRYYWPRFAELAGEAFGDLVHGWVPIHEPTRWALRGYLEGTRPPGTADDPEAFAAALESVLLAQVEAALVLRGAGQPVATSQWLAPAFPARLGPDAPPTPDAEAQASLVDETLRRCWLRLLTEETLVVPGRAPVAVPRAREAFDLVGFTYRHAMAVRGDGARLPYPQASPVGPDGQVAWAEGFGIVLHQLAEALPDRPLLATGVGIATDDEAQREEHLRDLLAIREEAVAGGVDLRGLWWDTPIDAATGPPRGLFDLDRAPRPAAGLWSDVAAGGPVPH